MQFCSILDGIDQKGIPDFWLNILEIFLPEKIQVISLTFLFSSVLREMKGSTLNINVLDYVYICFIYLCLLVFQQ